MTSQHALLVHGTEPSPAAHDTRGLGEGSGEIKGGGGAGAWGSDLTLGWEMQPAHLELYLHGPVSD